MLQRISAQAKTARIDSVFEWLVAILPYLLGWILGFFVRTLIWIWASFVVGFRNGRGE